MIASNGRGAALLLLLTIAAASIAFRDNEARLTHVVRDVQVLGHHNASGRSASANEIVGDGSTVRTGSDSRAELTFPDLILTRVGANTLFRFNHGGHLVEIDQGAVLVCVPENSRGARIVGDLVSVSSTGTTMLFETHPGDYDKLIVLEGHARAWRRRRPEQPVVLQAGQMLLARSGATRLPTPLDIDLGLVMKTATLITRFPPLPSSRLIAAAIADQQDWGLQLANPNILSTGLDARDVVAAIRSQSSPSPPKPGKPPGD